MACTAASSALTTIFAAVPYTRALAAAYAAMLPCQSRWSCVRFSTTAASGSKPRTPAPPPSSWKLDSSSTHTSGSGASSASDDASAAARVSSNAGPMLPAVATRRPARCTSKAVMAVVVVLPLVPVMASTCGA